DILDISKIEAGSLRLENAPVDLGGTIEGALGIIYNQAMGKGIEIYTNIAADLPRWIEADPVRLRQVLINLLSNAVKFTAKGTITLDVKRLDRENGPAVLFEVSDTGIGIPQNQQHLLFQSFSQIDQSYTRNHGGAGLGLAISKRLAEAMGGAVGVQSTVG